MVRWILGGLLLAHGIAHIVGFAVTWRFTSSPDVPFTTRILAGQVDVGGIGIRVIGVFWLIAAAAFVAAAAGVVLHAWWGLPVVMGAIGVSLTMCAVNWPGSRIGFYVNVALVLVVLLGPRVGLRLVSLVPGPTPAPVDRIQRNSPMPRPAVLCPVDFSDASRGALRYAAVIADHYDAEVIVLTVNDPLLSDVAAVQMGPAWLLGDSLRELHRFVAETFHGRSPAATLTFDVASGKPWTEILRVSQDRGCDLIVMSSRGLTGMRKLFFGTTTERVLRETTGAVLITPPFDGGPQSCDDVRGSIRRVLVPADMSARHPQVEVAARLAQTLDASLLLVHVVEPIRFPLPIELQLPSVDAERRSNAERLLAALAAGLTQDVKHETLVVFGDPAEEIAKIAHDRQAGLITIGLQASSVSGPRMGSVTYRVLCLSRTPVLALPAALTPNARLAGIMAARAASHHVGDAKR